MDRYTWFVQWLLVYIYFDPRIVWRISDNEQGHSGNSKFDDISGECLLFCKRFVQDAGHGHRYLGRRR